MHGSGSLAWASSQQGKQSDFFSQREEPVVTFERADVGENLHTDKSLGKKHLNRTRDGRGGLLPLRTHHLHT